MVQNWPLRSFKNEELSISKAGIFYSQLSALLMPVKKESSEKHEEESLETKKLKNWPLVSLEKNKYCNPHLYYVFVGESKVSFIVFSDTAIRFLIFIKTKFT